MKKSILRSKSERIVLAAVFVFFALYAISMIIPFVWAFLSSLKTDDEYFEKVFALPKDWLFGNYVKAFAEFKVKNVTFISMFFNSLYISVGGTFKTPFAKFCKMAFFFFNTVVLFLWAS